ncbi:MULTISPECIES: hypothetical protein [Cohaesibacter]|uniref:hypothetical protein n=1 Tax=Cohaesibacter TaxID=655352 RepID=UPI0013001C0B|nr:MULTISPECIES: hypothetical protein [Cohaesibacter]
MKRKLTPSVLNQLDGSEKKKDQQGSMPMGKIPIGAWAGWNLHFAVGILSGNRV